MITPEQSRQMAAYLMSREVLAMPVVEGFMLRKRLQAATSMGDVPEPHRSRILDIAGLETKGGTPDLQEPAVRP